jgi:hypothetical protein
MEYNQAGYLLKIILFVECQNLGNSVVFHDDAMNCISHSGMIFKNALSDVLEKLNKIIPSLRADLDNMYFQIF